LWLCPGTATTGTFGARVDLGGNAWGAFTGLTPAMHGVAVGKFNADAYDDVLAVETSTGKLWLFPGTAAGSALSTPTLVGAAGWNGMANLTVGKFNGDSYDDLLAVETSTGKLWLYAGSANVTDFGTRTAIGLGGWQGMQSLAVGRFSTDGDDDLIAVE